MVRAVDVLNHSYSHFGHPYSVIDRFGPLNYDCSGHVKATLRDFGVDYPSTSSEQYRASTKISLQQAVATPGSLIFMPANPLLGIGPNGHVAFSRGNGWTSEARGRAYGVGSWPIAGRGFSVKAGLIPALDYGGGGPVALPPNITTIVAEVAYMALLAVTSGPEMGAAGTGTTLDGSDYRGDEVTAWQNALNLTIHAGLAVDGDFGIKTAKATGAFQHSYNYFAGAHVVNEFGIVDTHTRAAMVQALENLLKTI